MGLRKQLNGGCQTMTFKPNPTNDLNEIYAVIPTPPELRGPPTDW